MGVTPKVQADMQLSGGRHYRGRGLGQLKAWQCVSCDASNTGPLKDGCTSCGAGKPGQQVRKPGETIPKADEKAARAASTSAGTRLHTTAPQPPGARRPASLAAQVRRAGAAAGVDYDEIERRIARVLDERLGGGYSASERARIYDALEVMITLWEDGTIDPAGGLSLEQTRALAQKVAPEEMEMADGNSTTTAAPERYIGDPDGDPAERGFTHGAPSDGDGPDEPVRGAPGPVIRARSGTAGANAALRPAPELLDADHRGDEGGQDNAAGDGG